MTDARSWSHRALDMLGGAAIAVLLTRVFVGGGTIDAREPATALQPEYLISTSALPHGGVLVAVFNTETEVLTTYEAEGGTKATRGLTFVGARKVARDIFVTGYNDKSEYSYQELVERIAEVERRTAGSAESSAGAGEPGGADKQGN
jgi:hypothetical protein